MFYKSHLLRDFCWNFHYIDIRHKGFNKVVLFLSWSMISNGKIHSRKTFYTQVLTTLYILHLGLVVLLWFQHSKWILHFSLLAPLVSLGESLSWIYPSIIWLAWGATHYFEGGTPAASSLSWCEDQGWEEKLQLWNVFRKQGVQLLTLGTAINPFHLSILRNKWEKDHFRAKLVLHYSIRFKSSLQPRFFYFYFFYDLDIERRVSITLFNVFVNCLDLVASLYRLECLH